MPEFDSDWEDFVYYQMEQFADNPSNRNKHFSNLTTAIEERVKEDKLEMLENAIENI